MTKIRRNYTKEFKLEIVKRSMEPGIRNQDLADEYGVHPGNITRWRRLYLKAGELSFPGKGNAQLSEDQKEIQRLKKELKDAQLEAEILKKAVRIFSKSDGKSISS